MALSDADVQKQVRMIEELRKLRKLRELQILWNLAVNTLANWILMPYAMSFDRWSLHSHASALGKIFEENEIFTSYHLQLVFSGSKQGFCSEDTEAVKTATYYSLGDRYTFTPIRYHFPWKTSVLHLVTRFFDHVNNFPTNENNRGRPANKQSKAHPWASFIINRIPNCLSISGIKLKYLSIFLLDQSEKEKTVTWLFRRTLAQCAMAYVLVWQWYW